MAQLFDENGNVVDPRAVAAQEAKVAAERQFVEGAIWEKQVRSALKAEGVTGADADDAVEAARTIPAGGDDQWKALVSKHKTNIEQRQHKNRSTLDDAGDLADTVRKTYGWDKT